MKRVLKFVMIILMIVGVTVSILNLMSVDNIASAVEYDGTWQPDGCYGEPLNCEIVPNPK